MQGQENSEADTTAVRCGNVFAETELQSCDKKCEVVGGAGGGDQRRKAQQLARPQPRLINLPACLLLLWPRLEEAAERTGVQ